MNRYGEKVRAEWRRTGRGWNVEGESGSKWNWDGVSRVEKRDCVRGSGNAGQKYEKGTACKRKRLSMLCGQAFRGASG